MSRETSQGLAHFPFNVLFFDDRKIKYLINRHSDKGINFYLKILCETYKFSYFMPVEKMDFEIFASDCRVTLEDAITMRDYCLDLGLFNKPLYTKFHILTSRGMQKRYFFGKLRAKHVEVDKKFLLVPEDTIPNAWWVKWRGKVEGIFDTSEIPEVPKKIKSTRKKKDAPFEKDSLEYTTAKQIGELIKQNWETVKLTDKELQKGAGCIAKLLKLSKSIPYIMKAVHFAVNDKVDNQGGWIGWHEQFKSICKLTRRADKSQVMYVDSWYRKASPPMPFEDDLQVYTCHHCRDTGRIITSQTDERAWYANCNLCDTVKKNGKVDDEKCRQVWGLKEAVKLVEGE